MHLQSSTPSHDMNLSLPCTLTWRQKKNTQAHRDYKRRKRAQRTEARKDVRIIIITVIISRVIPSTGTHTTLYSRPLHLLGLGLYLLPDFLRLLPHLTRHVRHAPLRRVQLLRYRPLRLPNVIHDPRER